MDIIFLISHLRHDEEEYRSDATVPEDYLEREYARQIILDLIQEARHRAVQIKLKENA